MGVDEPGEHCFVAEVDDHGVLGNGGVFVKRDNLIPLDDHDDILTDLIAPAVDQPPGFDNIGLIRSCKNR